MSISAREPKTADHTSSWNGNCAAVAEPRMGHIRGQVGGLRRRVWGDSNLRGEAEPRRKREPEDGGDRVERINRVEEDDEVAQEVVEQLRVAVGEHEADACRRNKKDSRKTQKESEGIKQGQNEADACIHALGTARAQKSGEGKGEA